MLKTRLLRTALPALLLAGTVVLIFARARGFDFTNYDEVEQIVNNRLIRGLAPADIARTFTSRSVTSYYPVRVLSFAVDYHFWELNPAGYHLTNVLIHAANALLLFGLIRRLARLPSPDAPQPEPETPGAVVAAALAAGLFALHPVVVEPVAWVPGREELLMTFFTLSCLHLFLRKRGQEPFRRRGNLPLEAGGLKKRLLTFFSFLAAAAAGMSNVVGAAVAFLLAALCLTAAAPAGPGTLRRRVAGAALRTAPFWLLTAGTVLLKKLSPASAAKTGLLGRALALTAPERAAAVLRGYAWNVKTIFWPDALALHPDPGPPWMYAAAPDLALLAGAALAIVTLAALWLARRDRLAIFGLLWFLLALAPTSQLIPHQVFRADRFCYLPLAGLAVAAFAGGRALASRLRPAWLLIPAAAAIVCAAAVRTSIQLPVWRDTFTVFRHCLAVNGDTLLAHANLAHALVNRKSFDEALGHLWRAAQVDPRNVTVQRDIGTALFQQGKPDQAEQQYRRALRLDPADPGTHASLAYVLIRQGRLDSAVSHCREALRVSPEHLLARENLALALGEMGDASLRRGNFDQAVARYHEALEARPADVATRTNLGTALLAQGRIDQAIEQYARAVQIDPGHIDAHTNWAQALLRQGLSEQALARFRRALEIDPNSPAAHAGLAWLLATSPDDHIRDGPQAVRHAQAACRAAGEDDPGALDALAAAHAEAGQFPLAVSTAARALDLAAAGDRRLTAAIQARLALYRRNQPFRQPAPPPKATGQ